MRIFILLSLLFATSLAQTGCELFPCLDGDQSAVCTSPLIAITCDGGGGQLSTGTMFDGQDLFVADIPLNTRDLVITLGANFDLDLSLRDASQDCLAGYSCMHDDEGTEEIRGMEIFFSGDDTSAPVSETIRIPHVTEPLTLFVYSYGDGEGTIIYEWSGITPCVEVSPRTCTCPHGYIYDESYGCAATDEPSAAPVTTTTGEPTATPSSAPTPIPYRVFVTFLESFSCSYTNPRISAMEWNFYNSDDTSTAEIASEFRSDTGDNDSPAGEGPANLSDDDEDTKWLSYMTKECDPNNEDDCVCTSTIEMHFTLDDMPTHYSYVTTEAGQLRDPAKWNVTLCCASAAVPGNDMGCGNAVNVNIFADEWAHYYTSDRLAETSRFPMGSCPIETDAPTSFQSISPTKTPSSMPVSSEPTGAPFSPSDAPSQPPTLQVYYEWNCTQAGEPTLCWEYTQDLTQICDPEPIGSDYEFCCSMSDGQDYCCDYIDQSQLTNLPGLVQAGGEVAQCRYTTNLCVQTCFVDERDENLRTCTKVCPDEPTSSPSSSPSPLCVDQDEVYDENGDVYMDGETPLSCEQVVHVLFTNAEDECTVFFARQCPNACDMCTKRPSLSPTKLPSLSPINPSQSPSAVPSRAPVPKCQDTFPVYLAGELTQGNCSELVRALGTLPCGPELSRACEFSCPNACTEWPTSAPSVIPSDFPSGSPSQSPVTTDPSRSPSQDPTRSPSDEPTPAPSRNPTQGCVDLPLVTSGFDDEIIGDGVTCSLAVRILFDADLECSGYLLQQCPDSCGVCTEEPSQTPTVTPTVECNDRNPPRDAQGVDLTISCETVYNVFNLQFNECDDHYKNECPLSCKTCTPMPSPQPVTQEPSQTPSQMPSIFVPSASMPTPMPVVAPTHAGPYTWANLPECDKAFNAVFSALVMLQNSCPDSAESCLAEYPELVCPDSTECPVTECTTPEPATTEPVVEEDITRFHTFDASVTCVDASNEWTFNRIVEDVPLDAGKSFCVIQNADSRELAVQYDNGNVYPTCVAYGDDFEESCDNTEFVCGDNDVIGFKGELVNKVVEAMARSDYRHHGCPTIQEACEPLNEWWQEEFVRHNAGVTSPVVGEAEAENLCINRATNEMRYVERDFYVNTCVGFLEDAQFEVCQADRDFLCSGFDEGRITYGWPGQISQSLGRAVEQSSKRHPHCPFN